MSKTTDFLGKLKKLEIAENDGDTVLIDKVNDIRISYSINTVEMVTVGMPIFQAVIQIRRNSDSTYLTTWGAGDEQDNKDIVTFFIKERVRIEKVKRAKQKLFRNDFNELINRI